MSKVDLQTEVPVSPDRLWKLIGGFNALPDWHPAVEKSKLEQDGEITLRRLTLAGGGSIVERLEDSNDGEHTYRYSIVESPLPVAEYISTIRVSPSADGTRSIVHWTSEFTPAGASEEEAAKAVEGIYRAGFENLKKLFGG